MVRFAIGFRDRASSKQRTVRVAQGSRGRFPGPVSYAAPAPRTEQLDARRQKLHAVGFKQRMHPLSQSDVAVEPSNLARPLVERTTFRVVSVAGRYLPARVVARPGEATRAKPVLGAPLASTRAEAEQWLAAWVTGKTPVLPPKAEALPSESDSGKAEKGRPRAKTTASRPVETSPEQTLPEDDAPCFAEPGLVSEPLPECASGSRHGDIGNNAVANGATVPKVAHSRFYRTKAGEIRLVTSVSPTDTLYLTYGVNPGHERRMTTQEFIESIEKEIPTPPAPSMQSH